jgi:hypothetical protein
VIEFLNGADPLNPFKARPFMPHGDVALSAAEALAIGALWMRHVTPM